MSPWLAFIYTQRLTIKPMGRGRSSGTLPRASREAEGGGDVGEGTVQVLAWVGLWSGSRWR